MFRESDILAIVLQNEDLANYKYSASQNNVLGQNVLPVNQCLGYLDYFKEIYPRADAKLNPCIWDPWPFWWHSLAFCPSSYSGHNMRLFAGLVVICWCRYWGRGPIQMQHTQELEVPMCYRFCLWLPWYSLWGFFSENTSVLEALAAVLSTCSIHERSSLMLTPKYLALSAASRTYPCSVYTGFLYCLLFVHMWMTWEFWGLNLICHLSSHSAGESKSCCRRAASLSFLICLHSSVSSANNLVSLALQTGRSLMNARNNSGPSTVPWGTPDTTSVCEETCLIILST